MVDVLDSIIGFAFGLGSIRHADSEEVSRFDASSTAKSCNIVEMIMSSDQGARRG